MAEPLPWEEYQTTSAPAGPVRGVEIAPQGPSQTEQAALELRRAENARQEEANARAAAAFEGEGGKLTEAEGKAVGFYQRMRGANTQIDRLGLDPADYATVLSQALAPMASRTQLSDERRSQLDAIDNFIAASLRLESGAAIGPAEFEKQFRIFFPQPGAGPKEIESKKQQRELAIRGFRSVAGKEGAREADANLQALGFIDDAGNPILDVPSPDGQTGAVDLEVSKGGQSATDQEIANALKLQEAWNNGATPDEINALSQQLIGAPMAEDQLEVLRKSQGQPVNFVPGMSGQAGEGGMGTAAAIGAGLLKGYTGNMAEEIVGTLGGDVAAAKLQAAGNAAAEEAPLTTFASELVGGVLSPLNKIPGLRAIENPLVREGLTGAVQGAVYGAGEAPVGASMEQRLEQGAAGALLGGAGGALAGKFLGGRAAGAADEAVPPSMDMPSLAPEGAPPLTEAAPAALPAEELTQLAELARKAVSPGMGAASARHEIAKMAKADPQAAAAAKRLGIDLPTDILSDSAQLKALGGLSRSQIGSAAQSEWGSTIAKAVERADASLAELGATRDLAEASAGVKERLTGAMEGLQRQAGDLRDEVDNAISATDRLEASSLQGALATRIAELGGLQEAKQAFSKEEGKLLAMLGEGENAKMPTYGRLIDLKKQIGRAIEKGEGPWVDVDQAALKRYYGALADDQLSYIEKVGGPELADKMRGSNTLFAKMYDARKDMQALFGRQLEGSLTPLLTRAIETGSKGDAKAINDLMSKVPEDMRGQLLASGLLAKASGTGYQGGFNFANYAKYYRGLRANSPVYAEFAKALGPKGAQVLTDLYNVSRRVAEGSSNITKTGASNQALLALNAERLMSRLFKSGAARAAGAAAGGAAGAVTGGPAGAMVGAGVADGVLSQLSGGVANADKLHSLLTSPQFKEMVESGSDGAVNKLAGSRPFIEWSKGIIPNSFKDRQAWIRSTINPVAANVSPEPETIEVGATQ